jgi:hypothetical protein
MRVRACVCVHACACMCDSHACAYMCRDEGGVQLARAAIAADAATEVKEWSEQVLFELKQLGRVVESACEGAGVSSTQGPSLTYTRRASA